MELNKYKEHIATQIAIAKDIKSMLQSKGVTLFDAIPALEVTLEDTFIAMASLYGWDKVNEMVDKFCVLLKMSVDVKKNLIENKKMK